MTIIGIDYGRKRLGIAVSDAGHKIATPLTIIERRGAELDASAIRKVAEEHGATGIVVGLPLRTDGKPSEMADEATAFAEGIREQTGLPVEMWDERLSTAQAERAMLDADISRARRKKSLDKAAAQIILQSYLDAQQKRRQSSFLA